MAGPAGILAEVREWRQRMGGTLFALWPNAASALSCLRRRLPLMPGYLRHARAIANMAESVGRRLGMDPDDLRTLRYAAVFHDIGKLAVPESILNKAGPLTHAERAAIERHSVVADEILAPVDFLTAVRPLVRHSHERWDGHGYPDGLAGERIPSGARVLTVCDAHQAMTADRPYRPALAPDAVRSELTQGAGTQFDARVVAALLDLIAA